MYNKYEHVSLNALCWIPPPPPGNIDDIKIMALANRRQSTVVVGDHVE